MMNYPDSYYVQDAASLIASDLSQSPAALPDAVDVIIIGGGFAGLVSALELARSGKSVALLESHRIGWGASGRNGGFVSAGFAEGLSNLISKLGSDHAAAIFALSREAVEYVRREAMAIDPAILGGHGALSAIRHYHPASMQQAVELYHAHGLNVRHVQREELRTLLKSDCYCEAIENREAFHIQPLTYCLGLAQKARTAGVQIFENCPVTALDKPGAGWVVRTDNQTIRAGHVVLAGSTYMSGLYPRLAGALLPVATYVITTDPMPQTLDGAITYNGCISDTRRAGDYYRRLPDGRLLWGGRITTRRSEPRMLARMLRQDIVKIYPQLGDFSISHAWSGLMGYAIHKMPIIGELEKGLWAVTGFGGHGLNTTAMGGQLIASAIADGDDRWQQFSGFGPQWAGGPVGRAAIQGVYWFMQARDWLDEKRNRK